MGFPPIQLSTEVAVTNPPILPKNEENLSKSIPLLESIDKKAVFRVADSFINKNAQADINKIQARINKIKARLKEIPRHREAFRQRAATAHKNGDNKNHKKWLDDVTTLDTEKEKLKHIKLFEERSIKAVRAENNNEFKKWQDKIKPLNAQLKALKQKSNKNINIDNKVKKKPTSTVTTNSRSGDFIPTIRKAYLKSIADNKRNPDIAHNAILVKLLFDDFSDAKLKAKKTDPKHIFAYSKVRASNDKTQKEREAKTGSPLYIVPQEIDFSKIPKNINFFVRDFLQVQGSGGKSKPWILGVKPNKIKNTEEIIINKERYGIHISDGIRYSKFQRKFDEYVTKINEGILNKKNHLPKFESIAHRDGIQLVPIERNFKDHKKTVWQMAGAMMENVIINGNAISSKGDFQGIFATDGAFQKLVITNNSVEVGGKHTISISGMLSGTIDGNTDLKSNPLPADKIKLLPLRIGGDANIYIMGFKNKDGDTHHFAYETIKGSQIFTKGKKQNDFRKVTPIKPHATYWKNVHMPTLQKLYNSYYDDLKKEVAPINRQWTLAIKDITNPKELRLVNDKYRKKAQKVWGKLLKQAGGIPMASNNPN